MTSSDESVAAREAKLREFGLSEYASRAYLALLQLGPSEARAVSRLARVPVAKIYSTLDQLAERCLCIIEPGPPKRFSPVPFARFLERLAAQHRQQAQVLDATKEELAAMFQLSPMAAPDDRGSFQVLRGRRAVVDKLRQLAESATSDVLIQAASHMSRRIDTPLGMIAAASDRSIPVRLIMTPGSTHGAAPDGAFRHVEMRQSAGEFPRAVMIAIYDSSRALIVHFVPDDGGITRGNDVALYTDEEAIVQAHKALLEQEWRRSQALVQLSSAPSRPSTSG